MIEENWEKSAKLVMHELNQLTTGQKEIQKEIAEIKEEITEIKIEIAKLQMKAGFVGGIAGGALAAAGMVLKAIFGK